MGVDFNGDFSLAPGRDLPGEIGSRAPSAGLDPHDLQRGISPILNRKIVNQLLSIGNPFKLKIGLWNESRWQSIRWNSVRLDIIRPDNLGI